MGTHLWALKAVLDDGKGPERGSGHVVTVRLPAKAIDWPSLTRNAFPGSLPGIWKHSETRSEPREWENLGGEGLDSATTDVDPACFDDIVFYLAVEEPLEGLPTITGCSERERKMLDELGLGPPL